MREENNVWVWILISDTWEGEAQTWDGFRAQPGGLLGSQASPLLPRPPPTPHVQMPRVWGLQYMQLTSCYDKYCKRVGAEELKIA